jgi:hypothetical protein
MCQHNLLQWVVSEANKCYDFHTDANEWTTKGTFQNDSYTSSSGIPLPSIEDAFTLTIAITRFPDPEKAVKITWKRSEMGEKARWSIVMTGNDIHFQLPRTQGFGILHAGEKAEESMMMNALQKIGMKITESLSLTEALADLTTKKQGNWRMVLSFRQVVSATSCPACYLMRFDQRPVLLKKTFLGSSDDNIVTGPLCIMENSIMHPEKMLQNEDKVPKTNEEIGSQSKTKDIQDSPMDNNDQKRKLRSSWRLDAARKSEWRKLGITSSTTTVIKKTTIRKRKVQTRISIRLSRK